MLEDKNKQTIEKTHLGSTKKKKIPRTQLNYFLLGMGYRLFFNIVYPGEKVSR